MKVHGYIVVIKRMGGDYTSYPLITTNCLIGRYQECDIRVQLPAVSKLHCTVKVDSTGKAYLTNLNKDNYTFVNGESITGIRTVDLLHNDIIMIADRKFRWEYPEGSKFIINSKKSTKSQFPGSPINEDKSMKNLTERSKKVSFGPYLSPEHFDLKLPPSTPVQKGEKPVDSDELTPSRRQKVSLPNLSLSLGIVEDSSDTPSKSLLKRRSPTPIKPSVAKSLGIFHSDSSSKTTPVRNNFNLQKAEKQSVSIPRHSDLPKRKVNRKRKHSPSPAQPPKPLKMRKSTGTPKTLKRAPKAIMIPKSSKISAKKKKSFADAFKMGISSEIPLPQKSHAICRSKVLQKKALQKAVSSNTFQMEITKTFNFGIKSTGHANSPAPIIIHKKFKKTPKYKTFKKEQKSCIAGNKNLLSPNLDGMKELLESPSAPTFNVVPLTKKSKSRGKSSLSQSHEKILMYSSIPLNSQNRLFAFEKKSHGRPKSTEGLSSASLGRPYKSVERLSRSGILSKSPNRLLPLPERKLPARKASLSPNRLSKSSESLSSPDLPSSLHTSPELARFLLPTKNGKLLLKSSSLPNFSGSVSKFPGKSNSLENLSISNGRPKLQGRLSKSERPSKSPGRLPLSLVKPSKRKSESLEKPSKSPGRSLKLVGRLLKSPGSPSKLSEKKTIGKPSKSPKVSKSLGRLPKSPERLALSFRRLSKSSERLSESAKLSKSMGSLSKAPAKLSQSTERSKSLGRPPKSPGRSSKYPERLSVSPGRPAKSPERLSKFLGRPSKSLEWSKSSERLPRSLERLSESIKTSESPGKFPKSCGVQSKSPGRLSKSPGRPPKSPEILLESKRPLKSPEKLPKSSEKLPKLARNLSILPGRPSKSKKVDSLKKSSKELRQPKRLSATLEKPETSKGPSKSGKFSSFGTPDSPGRLSTSLRKASKSKGKTPKSPTRLLVLSRKTVNSPPRLSAATGWSPNSPDTRSELESESPCGRRSSAHSLSLENKSPLLNLTSETLSLSEATKSFLYLSSPAPTTPQAGCKSRASLRLSGGSPFTPSNKCYATRSIKKRRHDSMASVGENTTDFDFSSLKTPDVTMDTFLSPLESKTPVQMVPEGILRLANGSSGQKVLHIHVDSDMTHYEFNTQKTPDISRELDSPISSVQKQLKRYRKPLQDCNMTKSIQKLFESSDTTDLAQLRKLFGESVVPQRNEHLADSMSRQSSILASAQSRTTTPVFFEGITKVKEMSKPQESPKANDSDTHSIQKLNLSESNYSNVHGIRKLMGTPRSQKESPKADYSNVCGLQRLRMPKPEKESPKADYSNVHGIRKLERSPRSQKKSPKADYCNVRGLKRLVRTPKPEKESPKSDYSIVHGIRRLMRTPRSQKESPKVDYSNVCGLKRLLRTPRLEKESPKADYTNTDGLKKLFAEHTKFNEYCKPNSDYDLGLRELFKSPSVQNIKKAGRVSGRSKKGTDTQGLEGLTDLFSTPSTPFNSPSNIMTACEVEQFPKEGSQTKMKETEFALTHTPATRANERKSASLGTQKKLTRDREGKTTPGSKQRKRHENQEDALISRRKRSKKQVVSQEIPISNTLKSEDREVLTLRTRGRPSHKTSPSKTEDEVLAPHKRGRPSHKTSPLKTEEVLTPCKRGRPSHKISPSKTDNEVSMPCTRGRPSHKTEDEVLIPRKRGRPSHKTLPSKTEDEVLTLRKRGRPSHKTSPSKTENEVLTLRTRGRPSHKTEDEILIPHKRGRPSHKTSPSKTEDEVLAPRKRGRPSHKTSPSKTKEISTPCKRGRPHHKTSPSKTEELLTPCKRGRSSYKISPSKTDNKVSTLHTRGRPSHKSEDEVLIPHKRGRPSHKISPSKAEDEILTPCKRGRPSHKTSLSKTENEILTPHKRGRPLHKTSPSRVKSLQEISVDSKPIMQTGKRKALEDEPNHINSHSPPKLRKVTRKTKLNPPSETLGEIAHKAETPKRKTRNTRSQKGKISTDEETKNIETETQRKGTCGRPKLKSPAKTVENSLGVETPKVTRERKARKKSLDKPMSSSEVAIPARVTRGRKKSASPAKKEESTTRGETECKRTTRRKKKIASPISSCIA